MPEKKSLKINEVLRNLADDSSKANSLNSSNTETSSPTEVFQGDPACPHCHGVGYIRYDVPIGHPEFGRVHVCSCRHDQVAQQVRQQLFSLSHLDRLSHLTFENFNPRGRVGLPPQQADSLETAFNQATQYSKSLEGWLVLQGDYGCGKTHLAAAIANFAVSLGVPTLFITVPDLLDQLRFSFSDPELDFETRFEQIRQSPLLILDDFGTQNATSWAQEKLFQIINYRYINHLPLVVTTNLEERDIEERIRSRLMDPELVTVVKILSPDYRNPKIEMSYHEFSSMDMIHKLTFASFDLRKEESLSEKDLKSLEKAFRAARDFAEDPDGWLVIIGPYGAGKTHLAAAIANFRADLGFPPIFVSVPDMLDHLRATFSPTSSVSLDRRFEEVRRAPLLILDDLGTQSATNWAREKLYQLFNYRYYADLPTVITTSFSLEEMDPRLRSRMLDKRLCTIYAITVPSYSGGTQPRVKRRRGAFRKETPSS